jgi:cellobiose phosphorylase
MVHSRAIDEPLIAEVLQAFAYWRRQSLKINLVILNQQATSYSSDLRNHLLKQIETMGATARSISAMASSCSMRIKCAMSTERCLKQPRVPFWMAKTALLAAQIDG